MRAREVEIAYPSRSRRLGELVDRRRQATLPIVALRLDADLAIEDEPPHMDGEDDEIDVDTGRLELEQALRQIGMRPIERVLRKGSRDVAARCPKLALEEL